jgi:hypothetical protein
MDPDAAARTLGVDRDASSEVVRAAYRQRARLLHPDLGVVDPSAMSELNEAYRTLRSLPRPPVRRSTIDDRVTSTASSDDAGADSDLDLDLNPSSVRFQRFIIASVVLLGLAVLMVYLAAAGYWQAH